MNQALSETDRKLIAHEIIWLLGKKGVTFSHLPSIDLKLTVGGQDQIDIIIDQAAGSEAFLLTSIEELGLPTVTANSLHDGFFLFAGQLVRTSEEEILKCRNMGKKGLDRIKEKLAEHGYEIGTRLPFTEAELAQARAISIYRLRQWLPEMPSEFKTLGDLDKAPREILGEYMVKKILQKFGLYPSDDA